jgi:hypothetical protein
MNQLYRGIIELLISLKNYGKILISGVFNIVTRIR